MTVLTSPGFKVRKLAKGAKASGPAFEFRGGNRDAIAAKENEVVLCGPAETGKTVAGCFALHLLCLRRPQANCFLGRKIQSTIKSTVLKTFERVTGGQGYRVTGGDTPSKFTYSNGSAVWIGGLDKPGNLLSAEYDRVYINQAEELTKDDWETVGTRVTGRAGHVQFPQLFGDCNPSGSLHWIRERAKAGKLRLLNSTHRDNPSLYAADGVLTADGALRMQRLSDMLTGVRRKRLLDGLWATAEGAVYDTFDSSPGGPHVRVADQAGVKRWLLCQDEGYTNPAVVLLVGEDSDGRWHVFREFYQRGVLQSAVVAVAREWCAEKGAALAAVDESAAGLIADLRDAGVNAVGGKGRVLDGVNAIQNRLKVQGDGRARLTVDPSCVNLVNEFESYVWKPNAPKDQPVKENDHALDALRYLVDALGLPPESVTADAVHTGDGRGQLGAERLDFAADRIAEGQW